MKHTAKQYPKFVVIASRDTMWDIIALDNTTKQTAIAEGVIRGFEYNDTEWVYIAKRVRKEDGVQVYQAFLTVYRDCVVEDISKASCNEWRVCDLDFISFK